MDKRKFLIAAGSGFAGGMLGTGFASIVMWYAREHSGPASTSVTFGCVLLALGCIIGVATFAYARANPPVKSTS